MLAEKELIKMLEETGALKKGHFKLTSGMHSSSYVQCAQLLKIPKYAEIAGKAIGEFFKDEKIDMVVGPAIGGIVIAYEVARALEVPGIFAERENGVMTLRRGFDVPEGSRVVVIEDVITTGGSSQEVVELLQERGAIVVGAGSIIDRSSPENLKIKVPYKSLLKLEIQNYDPEDCPMCKDGSPVVKPGSRNI